MMKLRIAAVSSVVVFAIVAGRTSAAERFVAGFGYVPPLHYRDDRGQPTGFVVDVLNEAARRERLEISWRAVGGSNDVERALANGTIDIFPAGVITASRRARFFVSDPWWSEDLSILVRAGDGISSTQDLRNRRVVLTSPTYASEGNAIIPGARLFVPDDYDSSDGPPATAVLVCTGRADGAMMAHLEMDEVLLSRPVECGGIPLQVFETAASNELAMLSRLEKRGLAVRLRNRIDELALDGTLAGIAARYPRVPARSAVALAETVRTRYQRRVLWTAFGGAMALVGIAGLLLLRQLRIQAALRRSVREQAAAEKALRARTEELTTSNEELQSFAYSVSHDLQEPLRMVGLYAELFERRCSPLSDDARIYLKYLRDGAGRMQEMVENLLTYSRIGRSDRPRTTVCVHDVLDNVLRDLDCQIQATGAEVAIGPMPSVFAWADRLHVLFQNLIGNALKYHRAGVPPRVEISAAADGSEWVFSVRDNGIGFKPEYGDRIFDLFKRLHGRDEYGGTGLGLAIARRVVERHGGRIWAEGRPGEGSTFYFALPVQPTGEDVPITWQTGRLPAVR